MLGTDLAAVGGIGYAAWQIIGKWYQYRAGVHRRGEELDVFAELDMELGEALKGGRELKTLGAAAAASGQGQLLEDFMKMAPHLKTALVDELLELADWSGQLKLSKSRRPWREMGGNRGQKARALSDLDALSFEWTEGLKNASAARAASWLWQVTEAVPVVSAEPVKLDAVGEELPALQRCFNKADTSTRTVLDAQKAKKLRESKSAVGLLAVATATRNMQALNALLAEVGLSAKAGAEAAAKLRTLLQALVGAAAGAAGAEEAAAALLLPRTPVGQAAVAVAEGAMKAEVAAVVEAARQQRSAAVEADAAAVEALNLAAAAGADAAWAQGAAGALQLALVEAVLGALGAAPEGSSPSPVLVEAARKLVPRLKLPDPEAPAHLVQQAAAAAAEVQAAAAASEAAAAAFAEAEAAASAEGAGSASGSDEDVVAALVAAAVRNVVAGADGSSDQKESSSVAAAKAEAERAAAAAVAAGAAATAAAAERDAAVAVATAERSAAVAECLEGLGAAEKVAEAAGKLATLLAEALQPVLAAAPQPQPPTASTDAEAVVAAVVGAAVRRVIIAADGVSGLKAERVVRPEVVAAVRGAAAAARAAHQETATRKLEAELSALSTTTWSRAVAERVGGAGALAPAERLAAVTAHLRDTVLKLTDGGAMAAQAAAALALLTAAPAPSAPQPQQPAAESKEVGEQQQPKEEADGGAEEEPQEQEDKGEAGAEEGAEAEGAAAEAKEAEAEAEAEVEPCELSAAGLEAVAVAQAVAEQVLLAAEVSAGRLQLGPGAVALLDRADAHLAAQQQQAAEAAAAVAAAEGQDESSSAPAAVPPAYPAASLVKSRALVGELLGDGLVLLELQGPAYRKLQQLRETVDGLLPDQDAAVFNKGMTQLKELVGGLGPVGAAVEARLTAFPPASPRRGLLSATRESSLAIVRVLQELIAHEGTVRAGVTTELAAMKELVYGIKVERKSLSLDALITRLAALNHKAATLTQAITGMVGSDDAISDLFVMEERVERLMPVVRDAAQYVRLREFILGAPVAAPHPDDIVLASLDELKGEHSRHAVWQDLPELSAAAAGGVDEEGQEVAADEAAGAQLAGWRLQGFQLIARGRVGVVSMIGGVDPSTGDVRATADFGLPSTKPLLQLYAERLVRLQRLAAEVVCGRGAGVRERVQWYIQATPSTLAAVRQYLKDNAYFGLQAAQVHVYACDVCPPALSEELKILMESSTKVARTPGGSGELFLALRRSGMLRHMQRSGVTCVDVHAVEDNVMARLADPLFLGTCESIHLDCAAKVLAPEDALPAFEPLADVAGDRVAAVLGGLVPAAGQYYFSAAFLRQVDALLSKDPLSLYRLAPADKLPSRGQRVAGFRLERTLADWVAATDLLPTAQRGLVVVDRQDELAPVWGSGQGIKPLSPTSAVESLLLLHTSWVQAAGGRVGAAPQEQGRQGSGKGGEDAQQQQQQQQEEGHEDDEELDEETVVEVSPLVSYGGEGLDALVAGRTFTESYDLDLQGYGVQPGQRAAVGGAPWALPLLAAWGAVGAAKLALTVAGAAAAAASAGAKEGGQAERR